MDAQSKIDKIPANVANLIVQFNEYKPASEEELGVVSCTWCLQNLLVGSPKQMKK